MGEEVGCPVDEGLLFGCEFKAKCGDVVFEVMGIIAVFEDGVGEPAFVEIPGALHGEGIGGGVREGDLVAAVGFEGDGAVEAEGFAEAVGFGVGEEDVVAAEVFLVVGGDVDGFEVVEGLLVWLAFNLEFQVCEAWRLTG